MARLNSTGACGQVGDHNDRQDTDDRTGDAAQKLRDHQSRIRGAGGEQKRAQRFKPKPDQEQRSPPSFSEWNPTHGASAATTTCGTTTRPDIQRAA